MNYQSQYTAVNYARAMDIYFVGIHGFSMTTLHQRRWLIGNVRMVSMVNQGGIQDHGKEANRIDSL